MYQYMAARRLSQKMYKNPQIKKLQKIQNPQKMNYTNYAYNKTKMFIFLIFQKSKKSNVFLNCWDILYNKSLF